MRESIQFLKEWVHSPRQIAAIGPSSPSLARIITSQITPDTAPVIELGPGTGAFTRAMIKKGVPESKIAMVELNSNFAKNLRNKFPKAKVLNMSATDLADHPVLNEKVGAVVSGLGLLSMPNDVVDAILTGVLHHLRPEGNLFQFTYGPTCSVPDHLMRKHNLTATRIGSTLRNIPPASVYAIHKTP